MTSRRRKATQASESAATIAARALANLRLAKQTPEQRRDQAITAARARWSSSTPEQRAAVGQALAKARNTRRRRKQKRNTDNTRPEAK